MRVAAGTLVVLLLSGCSSGGGTLDTAGSVLNGIPAPGTTACTSVRAIAATIRSVYGAPVTKTSVYPASRTIQTRQTGCVVDVKGESVTTLALYLWFGSNFNKEWADELNFVGTDGLTEQPYGREAYGRVFKAQTLLDVRAQHFAVRLICGPTPAEPTKSIDFKGCGRLLLALDRSFKS